MDLFKSILLSALNESKINIEFSNSDIIEKSFNNKCYNLLVKITEILKSESYTDDECYFKIEEIVCLFEDNKIDCGNSHNY